MTEANQGRQRISNLVMASLAWLTQEKTRGEPPGSADEGPIQAMRVSVKPSHRPISLFPSCKRTSLGMYILCEQQTLWGVKCQIRVYAEIAKVDHSLRVLRLEGTF